MAKGFKEITQKAEQLIEQGREADQAVTSCQASVASATSRVIAARRQLASASESDEQGNPIGDVDQARAQLSIAENQLAASQRALSSARTRADQVKAQKNTHVHEIERHNQVERSNLEKLKQLRSSAFGKNSAALTEGIAQRLNEAEDARANLLRSMGIDATPEHVAVEGTEADGIVWQGGGFSSIDTAGQVLRFQGGNSEGLGASPSISAPIGGGLNNSAANQAELENEQSVGTVSGIESIDHLVNNSMEGGDALQSSQWQATPRTPNEILADMKKAIRENWMNNFNADEWKRILPEKLYQERLDLYRKGIAAVVGSEIAESLSIDDLEQISRVQNHAYLSGCMLNETEIAELYANAQSHQGNFVTKRIEYKMDRVLQERAHGLLRTPKYSFSTWQTLSVTERKEVLKDLLNDVNSILGTNVSNRIDFFYEESGSRGAYSSYLNSVRINECLLAKKTSYQLTQTMIHELRHAYQHYSISNEKSVLVSSQTIKAWQNNFNNYKSPSNGCSFEEYLSQPVEWDAKNFAKQFTDIMGIHPYYTGSWA